MKHKKLKGFNNMNEFAKRLKLLRTRKELSYEELAVAVGSTKSLMWRYENGKSDPGLPTLIKLADYFGVTLDWLGGGGDFEKIQYAGKEKYYNAINKCIENEISPERLEQIIEVIGK